MKNFEMYLKLSEYDTQTNVKIPFEIKGNYSQLIIYFAYTPNRSRDEVAKRQVELALKKYALPDYTKEERTVRSYLPVDNLITLSLSKNGKYIGAHHNKKNRQQIKISNKQASFGFWPVDIEPAEWELQLNCHCIASKLVEAKIRIEVRE